MLVFWNLTLIVGFNVKGFYLVYILFWLVFFVPAIIHFDIPRKLLQRVLPLLEQLDHSMKYERRSILDKKDLLVDVKLPTNEIDDDEEEDEYLKSFQLKENEHRSFDDDDEDDDDNNSEENDNLDADEDDDDDEEVVEETYEIQNYIQYYKPESVTTRSTLLSNNQNEEKQNITNVFVKKSHKNYAPVKPSDVNVRVDNYDDDLDALLPDESMPSINDVTDSFMNSSNDEAFYSNYNTNNKVLKRRVKNRPSLLDYYGDALKTQISNNNIPDNSSKKSQPKDQHDIYEAFDFLDDELNKYH
jgi:hypothetical protein